MKQLLIKLISLPIIAMFPMLLSVAFIGSFWDIRDLEWLFPNKNAMRLWLTWIVVLAILVVLHHFLKKKVEE